MVGVARVFGSSAFIFILSLSSLSKMAAQAAPAQPSAFEGEPFTSSIAELKSASAAMPVTKEFGAEILYEEGIYRIAADRTLKYQHRMIYRVDTESTVKGWAEISSGWDPWFENPSQLRARVLQPSGSFVELDQKTITDAPVKAEDSETFSSRHVRRAPLPGMAIGAIVEEMQGLEEKTPYFSEGALYRFVFRQNVPVGRVRVIVELPATMPYKELIHELPGLSITRSEANGIRRVVYEATGLAASHNSDIDLATNAPTAPMVEFSTGKSWAAVAGGYAALTDPQTLTAEMGSRPRPL